MKIFRLFLIPILLISSPRKVNPLKRSYFRYQDDFDYIYMPPTSGGTISMRIDTSFSTFKNVTRTLEVYFYKDTSNTSELIYEAILLKQNTSEFTVTSYSNSDNLKILAVIRTFNLSTSMESIKQKSIILRRTQGPINLALNGFDVETDARIYTYENGVDRYISERYIFSNVATRYTPVGDSCFAFSDVEFEYMFDNQEKELTYQSASLFIDNTNHIFDEVKDENITGSGCVISLLLYKNDGKYRFIYKDPIYVNPNNLMMSRENKEGYIRTNNFFFPLNYFSNIDSTTIILTVSSAGINR
ncbi:MAG: hypothetical protein HUJ61_02585, partial [Bacilli bacterium]|nr:hypothetical protein [Bacilli bacterium]